jgi:hypothetical protein
MAIFHDLSRIEAVSGAALLFPLTSRIAWPTGFWPLDLPWGEASRYVKKFKQEFGFLNALGLGQQIAIYVMGSQAAGGSASGVSAESLRQSGFSDKMFDAENIVGMAVKEKKALLMVGAPTSGKTTLLQLLAVRSADRDFYQRYGFIKPRIPFYLPIKEINFDLPFFEALPEVLSQNNFPITKKGLARAVRSRRAFFLFDGLEEIPAGAQRRKACEWLENAQQTCGGEVPFVVACRAEALFDGIKFNFPHITVAIRNFALQQHLRLRAVSESRMPPRFFNPTEEKAEYMLIDPPSIPVVLRGAKKSAPTYYYYLAKFPVTNRLYKKFIEATQHRPPAFWDDPDFNDDDFPVVGVDWEDAQAYCQWLTEQEAKNKKQEAKSNANVVYRLPLEEEWEWAASGGKRKFPWGDESPQQNRANFNDNDTVNGLSPVQAHPDGATPEGLMDMAGNVWEWTATWWDEKKEQRAVRGGAGFNAAAALRCIARNGNANKPMRFAGFRVARIVED